MRRNKSLGLWAASRLNLRSKSLRFAEYIASLGLSERNDRKFLLLFRGELARRGLHVPESVIRAEMEHQEMLAARQVRATRTSRQRPSSAPAD
jgi:hypothetical protein